MPEYVGPAVGVLGLVAGLYYFLANRKPKRLSYYVRSSQPLLTSSTPHEAVKLEVLVAGKRVTNPVTSVVRIENSGKVEIEEEDHKETLSLDFGAVQVLSVSAVTGPQQWKFDLSAVVTEREPGNVSIRLPATLFNPGDYVDVQVLTDGKTPVGPVLRGRLKGTTLLAGTPRPNLRAAAVRMSRVELMGLLAVLLTVVAAVLGAVTSIAASRASEVPEVRNVSVGEAVQRLNKAGFHVRTVNKVPSTQPPGTVLDQSPAPFERSANTAVSLVVAE